MEDIIIPEQINISKVIKIDSLSPNNYREINIPNKCQTELKDYLDDNVPYIKGEEPGSITYVRNSNIRFLRNSCINKLNYGFDREKLIYLNPKYGFENMLNNHDILLCKDANIGDTCLFIKNSNEDIVFSSGLVKLNFKEEKYKYYCLALLKDSYFLKQLDALTPKGSTMRHSGELFLKCKLPDAQGKEWVYEICENITKNIAYAEHYSYEKLSHSIKLIEDEIIKKQYSYVQPTFSKLGTENRVDAGIYSDTVFNWYHNVLNYEAGYQNLEEYGFKLKRGPNLAKRDLGRSIQTKEYKPNFNVLVYPSDISNAGYILEETYLGARNPVWFLEKSNILFSAEGVVGKTFAICDETMKFTTNFHGTIIYPVDKKTPLYNSIFLALYLNYLRQRKILEKMAVGGNGGSFAIGYWDMILIPKVNDSFKQDIAKLYYSPTELNVNKFDESKIKSSGIFNLNNFRIQCFAVLQSLIDDLKTGKLKDKSFYIK